MSALRPIESRGQRHPHPRLHPRLDPGQIPIEVARTARVSLRTHPLPSKHLADIKKLPQVGVATHARMPRTTIRLLQPHPLRPRQERRRFSPTLAPSPPPNLREALRRHMAQRERIPPHPNEPPTLVPHARQQPPNDPRAPGSSIARLLRLPHRLRIMDYHTPHVHRDYRLCPPLPHSLHFHWH